MNKLYSSNESSNEVIGQQSFIENSIMSQQRQQQNYNQQQHEKKAKILNKIYAPPAPSHAQKPSSEVN